MLSFPVQELFPTETRAMSHGLAAATGKVRLPQRLRNIPTDTRLLIQSLVLHKLARQSDTGPEENALSTLMLQVGALIAGVVFGLVPDRAVFYISAFCGLLGVITTFLLVPDISGLELSEGVSMSMADYKQSIFHSEVEFGYPQGLLRPAGRRHPLSADAGCFWPGPVRRCGQ